MIAWNSKIVGLGVRSFPGGRQSWIYVRRVLGKQKWHTLGKADHLTEEQAIALVTDIDRRIDGLTAPPCPRIQFRDLALLWLESRSELKTLDQCRRRLNGRILPRLGSLRLNEITPLVLQSLHNEWSKGAPFEANRLIDLTSSILSFAVRMGYLSANPARAVMKNRERARQRYLDDDEIPRLLDAIELEPELTTRVALKVIVSSGMRKNEVLRMRWENIRRPEGGPWTLTVHNTKNGRDLRLELPWQLCAELKKLGEKEEGWVFPARQGDGHLSRIENAWSRVRLRAGAPDIRAHDMRRTFVWIASRAGHADRDIALTLNHTGVNTLHKHYRPVNEDAKARVLESVSRHIKRLKRTHEQKSRG